MSDRTQKKETGIGDGFPLARLLPRRAPGARGKAKEGEDRTRTRQPFRPGGGFSPPRAAAGYDRGGARGRNRQAASASIPWPPLVPGARGRVPRESSGPATGAPRAGSVCRAKVPGAVNGVRAGRARALQGGRVVGRERRSKSANRDSAVRSMRGSEKARKAKTSPSRFRKSVTGVIPPKAAGATEPGTGRQNDGQQPSLEGKIQAGRRNKLAQQGFGTGARRGWIEGIKRPFDHPRIRAINRLSCNSMRAKSPPVFQDQWSEPPAPCSTNETG